MEEEQGGKAREEKGRIKQDGFMRTRKKKEKARGKARAEAGLYFDK